MGVTYCAVQLGTWPCSLVHQAPSQALQMTCTIRDSTTPHLGCPAATTCVGCTACMTCDVASGAGHVQCLAVCLMPPACLMAHALIMQEPTRDLLPGHATMRAGNYDRLQTILTAAQSVPLLQAPVCLGATRCCPTCCSCLARHQRQAQLLSPWFATACSCWHQTCCCCARSGPQGCG